MTLTDEQKGRLAYDLKREIDQSIATKRNHLLWWAEVRKMKLARSEDQSVQLIKGMRGFYMALYRPKRNGIIDTTFSSLTSIEPIVQVLDPSEGGGNLSFAQKSLQNLARKGGFAAEFKDALGWALDVNLGTLRVTPLTEGGKVNGIKIESIDPVRLIGWPCGFKDFDKLKTIGHCYYELVGDVIDKIEDGTYDLGEVGSVKGGASPRDDSLDMTYTNGPMRGLGEDSPANLLDRYVRIFDVVTKFQMDPNSTKRTRLAVIFDYTDAGGMILSCDHFAVLNEDGDPKEPYPMWYVPVRATWDSDEGLWPEDSIGRPCVGPQEIYNRNINTIQQGGQFAAFGVHIISGGALKTKVIKMTPGLMIEAPAGVTVSSLSFPFNPQYLQFVNDVCEKTIDTLMGRTQLGTGANIAASTSATAINALQQAQAEAKDGYIDQAAPAVEEVYRIIWFYLKHYWADLSKALPQNLDIPNWDQIKDLDPEFQVTGQSSASNPQGLVTKLLAVVQMLAQPIPLPPGSRFDIDKIHERIIEAMDLPFATKELMHTIIQNTAGEVQDMVRVLMEEGYTPLEIKRGLMIFMQSRLQAMQQAAEQQTQEQQDNGGPQQLPPAQGQPGGVQGAPGNAAPNAPPQGGGTPAPPSLASPEEEPPEPDESANGGPS